MRRRCVQIHNKAISFLFQRKQKLNRCNFVSLPLYIIFDVQLVSLNFGSDPLVEETDVFTGQEVLTTDPGSLGTLVFVVRRPG